MTASSCSPAVFRIIGGKWRGRKIHFCATPTLRPSGARVRETLFNCLGQQLDGRICLDLFAGGGALGLEAASRGAQLVVCVEKNVAAARAIRRTVALLNTDNVRVQLTDATAFLATTTQLFDIVFLDPPFADYTNDEQWRQLLAQIAPRLSARGIVYCESDRHLAPPFGWTAQARKQAGAVCWRLLSRTP